MHDGLNSASITRRSLGEATFWMVCLSLLFFGVYQGCHWVTARRLDVGICVWEWEKWIPFIPMMIVPYWSIDLFFAASLFVCQGREELRLHVQRIIFVILVAGTCFLLFPLQLAEPRPVVGGFLGVFFRLLYSFDLPYNLAPSLHIALRSILWPVYIRHTRGSLNMILRIWFITIGISTLTLYQHHFVDVIAGQFLAMLCLYLLDESTVEERTRRTAEVRVSGVKRYRLALGYGILSLACMGASMVLPPWGLLMVWPAFGLAMLACGYFWMGPAIFHKRRGYIPLSTRLIFLPYLAGAHISYYCYARKGRPYVEVISGLKMGRFLNEAEAVRLITRGPLAVLDLTSEFRETKAFRELPYRNIQIMDLTPPTPDQIAEGVSFIEDHMRKGSVYVHCALGYSRSASMVVAYLLATGKASSIDEGLQKIAINRPEVVLGEEYKLALRKYEDRLKGNL